MKFFTDTRDNLRPLSAIRKISPGEKTIRHGVHTRVYDVVLADDDRCQISEYEKKRIEDSPLFLVPAEPGTFVLSKPGKRGEADFAPWRTPVVAWALSTDGLMAPYTPDGMDDGLDTPPAILFPNGMVIEQAVQSWRNESDWIESVWADQEASETAGTDEVTPPAAEAP